MRTLVTGATGFIGRRLVGALDGAVVLGRDPARMTALFGDAVRAHAWDATKGPPPPEAFADVEAIVHLAGDPIAEGRWSAEKKARLRDSRVLGTRHLVDGLRASSARPRVLVSASAIGYYGERGDDELDERAPAGSDFLAELCRDWEAEAGQARALGVRVATVRLGILLGEGGGALEKMLPPFRLGVGGRLGNGQQWMSWIHLDDAVGLLLHALRDERVDGAMNGVAPHPVRNREFTHTLAKVLRRPAVLPVPAAALRLLFGEFASFLLGSQRVLPREAERTGYAFRHPQLEGALRAVIGRPAPDAP
jgi:uncharacterized protein (TIGR01777 family)